MSQDECSLDSFEGNKVISKMSRHNLKYSPPFLALLKIVTEEEKTFGDETSAPTE